VAQPPQKPGGLGPAKLGSDKPMAGLESASEAAGKSHATDALAETCQHLEDALEELKVKHEMYFLGVERLDPGKKREELKRDIARLKTAFTRNTGLRFRIQSLYARYLSYERMWLREVRQREEGTSRRDIFKARLRSHARPEKAAEKRPAAAGGPGAGEQTPEPRAQARGPGTAAPASPRGAPQPSAAAGGLGEPQMRALYDAYLTAKKRCNEDTSRLTFDAVARSVNKQIPELMTRFQAKAVDFKVVIKDGKALLKAVPRT
jgi:HPt (histidine-containing phosphotransfer) domain-containing protein